MKILPRLLLVLGAAAGTALVAQENPTSMSTPPPPPPSSETAPASEPVRIDGLIHVQQLPSAAQLMNDAEAEHMVITRMEQLSDRIIVTYRYASGNTRTFAYTTVLPGNPEMQAEATPAPSAPSPSYTVVYTEPVREYYYPRYVRSYDPYYWPSSSFSLGIGFGRGYGTYGNFGYSNRPRYTGPSHYGHWRRH